MIGYFLPAFFFFFSLPLIPQMAIGSWFSASSEAVSAAYLCNGPVFKGLIPPCLALFVILSPCVFLCHAPGNWSKTLTMPPHHKYSHLKDVSGLHILNTDWPVLTPEFHYELAVASELPSRLPILGCLESLLSLCQLQNQSEILRFGGDKIKEIGSAIYRDSNLDLLAQQACDVWPWHYVYLPSLDQISLGEYCLTAGKLASLIKIYVSFQMITYSFQRNFQNRQPLLIVYC